MNALVRKEMRLLLPGFVVGLLAAFSIWLVPDEPGSTWGLRTFLVNLVFLASPASLVLMTLGSFGRELSAGTFLLLLAQPVSRSRVWWTKTLLLAAAVTLIWVAWWLSLSSNKAFAAIPRKDRSEAFLVTVLFVIGAYSGGLWTTLLVRQLAAAFWLTLLTPAALATAIAGVLRKLPDAADPVLKPALVIGFSVYSVVGFLFARWLFLRAQDTHWTGGTIALPAVGGLSGWFARGRERRQWRPRAALWFKELQLHQSQFVLAVVLALLHLAAIATRTLGGGFKDSPALAFLLEQIWVLWLAMPLMVGCAAVAEERKLGTIEAQLCLPSRRRNQFVIKFASALLLSVALGAAMPLLFEGNKILAPFQTESGQDGANYTVTTPEGTIIPIGEILVSLRVVRPFLTLAGIATFIAILSFYASTLARSTLQALSPAMIGIIGSWLLFAASHLDRLVFGYTVWRGGLVYLIGVPVMTVVLAQLMYWNFKRALVGWNVWRRNALVLGSALGGVMAATTVIYNRVWEHFMTLEPPHGPARLTGPVSMEGGWFRASVQFPDGRNWSSVLKPSVPNWSAMLSGDFQVEEIRGTAGYLEGTNWASVARSFRDVVGIQKDGSLWVSERPEKLGAPPSPSPVMIRVENDADWKTVAGQGSLIFLLKTNGTLWSLGTNRAGWKSWPGFRAFVPERLGSDSDWVNVSVMEHDGMAFQKTDGRVWTYRSYMVANPEEEQIRLDTDLTLVRTPYLDEQRSAAATWTRGRSFRVGVGDDGQLRVIAYFGPASATNSSRQGRRWIPQSTPLGEETNWLSVADNRYDVVALKTDGSLWKLSFPTDPILRPESFRAVPLSQYSDWVGLAGVMDGMIGLAADGSLWFWAMEKQSYNPSSLPLRPLLAPSRRPQLIGNIFAPSAQ